MKIFFVFAFCVAVNSLHVPPDRQQQYPDQTVFLEDNRGYILEITRKQEERQQPMIPGQTAASYQLEGQEGYPRHTIFVENNEGYQLAISRNPGKVVTIKDIESGKIVRIEEIDEQKSESQQRESQWTDLYVENQDTSRLVREKGYPVQTLFAETTDGYTLEVTRIPGKQGETANVSGTTQSGRIVRGGKPAVLLMHGIFSDASEFLINSENSIAYLLADKGYDVFLGNFRGVRTYDNHHRRLSGHNDRAFWDYCFDDMGVKDLPAIIDKILEITRQRRLYYIGVNQANSALYALLSQKPEYNNKIEKAVALGPLAFMEHSRNPILQLISDNFQSSAWVTKSLGSHQFMPSEEFMNQISSKCIEKHGEETLCRNLYFLINGFGQSYQSNDVASKYARTYPIKTATRELTHYAQLMKTNTFQPFRQNEDNQEYDLSKVTVPVVIVSVPGDVLADERDVDMLQERLPQVEEHIKINDYSSNLDLILDSNVRGVVYDRILRKLTKSSTKTQRKV